ncbi:AI-2E family transporter [Tropicimonas aquimaris]|uniref:AI-2E family transporter n=1 Tax=Tropicimonas aquimaris TaxID=914152 RepID=A0ABW3ILS1_9RHOB
MTPFSERQIIDLAIRIGFIAIFVYGAVMLVAPLIGLMLWAVILAVAVYPLHRWLSRLLGGRVRISAALLTILGLMLVAGPVALLAAGIFEAANAVAESVDAGTFHIPPPPESIRDWALVGPKLHEVWTASHANLADTLGRFVPQILRASGRVLGELAGLGIGLLMMALSVLIMGALLVVGPGFAAGTRTFADRIFETSGPELLDMAGATVRNVSRGVIGVAVIQALMAGIIMGAFGLAAAGPLALACLLLAVIQIGAGPVLLPTIIWAWTAMDTSQAVLFTVLLAPVTIIDNILKPIFMGRGLDTPMLVILVGVLGGLMAYGVVGIFVGPVILAVFHRLLVHWINQASDPISAAPEQSDGKTL